MKANKKYKELKEAFSFLIKEQGFHLIYEEPYDEKHFGNAYADLASDAFKIRLVVDRGDEPIVEISPNNEPETWIGLDGVRSLLLGTPLQAGTIDELSTFLKEHIDEIKIMFNKENIKETMTQIEKIEKEELRRMFPQLYKEEDQEQKQ